MTWTQRTFKPKSMIDLATLTGVDPWPPWPAGWPPNLQTVAMWLGGVSGAVLLKGKFGS